MPYEIGPGTVAVPGIPAGAHHLWRTLGPAAVAGGGRTGLRRVVRHARSRETHARLLPRVAAAMAVGEGSQVFRRPDGVLLQAGDPLRHRRSSPAYELLADDPAAFYRGAYAEALVRLWPTAAP